MSGGKLNWDIWGFVALSVALHGVLAVVMPSEVEPRRRPAMEPPSEMEFLVLEDPQPAEEPAVEPPTPESAPPPRAEVAAVTPPPAPAIAAVSPPARERSLPDRPVERPDEPNRPADGDATDREASVADAERPSTRPDDRSITVRGGLQLDPRAVALGTYGGPRAVRPQDQDVAPGESSGAASRRLSRELGGALSQEANRRDYITRRAPPVLQPRRDGSFAYSGIGFSARILPNGEVQFSDMGRAQFGGGGSGDNSLGATVRFDIMDGAERRHGNDPYLAERRHFLEHTEELRDRMADEHRRTQSVGADRRLRGQLARIWEDAGRTAELRRRALFDLWDDMAEDETGAPARQAVVTFIRLRCPRGADDGYGPDELTRLNARRRSQEPFAPY